MRNRIHAIIRAELDKPLRSLPEFTDDTELVEDLGAGLVDIVCIFIAIEENDWLNRICITVPDEKVVASVEGDIAAKKRELKAAEG